MKKAKFLIYIIPVVFSLCILFSFCASAISVNPNSPASLTVVYKTSEKCLENTEIRTYRIADVSEDGKYTLCENFKNYPVSLYNKKSLAEWKHTASTLASYIKADNIPTQLTGLTDSSGKVEYSDILPGMYLTMSVTYTDGNEIIVFEDFLTAVPTANDDGVVNYDVTAFPKHEKHQKSPDKIELSVIKQWKDTVFFESRPKSVTVDIFKNGELQMTEILSPENNWTYKWQADDDGAVWTTVERDIPKEYIVTVEKSGNCFIITNIKNGDFPDLPQTGDTTVYLPYFLTLLISGSLLIILGIGKKRSSE